MQSTGSATLPRGFRFHYQDGERPRTPDAPVQTELQPPSPPRARLRVKRRNVSQISRPTEQFLASVAAADIPLPTIEVPQIDEDEQMLDRSATPLPDKSLLTPQSVGFAASPPHTPLPQLFASMDDNNNQRRAWYMGTGSASNSIPERPSSSLSNPSDYSDDSYFSASRISQPSEDGSCTTPDSDVLDPFVLPPISKSKGKEQSFVPEVTSPPAPNLLNGQIRSKTRNDAPWSKEMSEHLWQTYQVYLQDPTVTPFRIGASAVPPEGVIHRVAREAKRSWKGPKPASNRKPKRRAPSLNIDLTMSNVEQPGSPDTATSKSGSLTPTIDTTHQVYLQWQHSSAATRNHLRELCKKKDSASVQRYRHMQSRSPTPFTHTRLRTRDVPRISEPAPQNTFSTQDVALSLITSSSQSMQPDGPLSRLAQSSRPASSEILSARAGRDTSTLENVFLANAQARRLGSPFTARTYGPSSSNISSSFSKRSPPRGKPDTVSSAGPSLGSPLRFKQPRSWTGTQKRRAQHALEDELSPNGAVIRPSILDEQLFGGPLESHQRRVRSRGCSLGEETLRNSIPGSLQAQADGANDSLTSVLTHSSSGSSSRPVTPLLPSVEFRETRLGSPFAEGGTSNTFPRRLLQPMDGMTTIRRRGFATVHHTRRSIESFDFGDGPSLHSRLRLLDEKLAEIRDREASSSKQTEE